MGCMDWLFHDILALYHTISSFKYPGEKSFENMVGKGTIAGYQHFLFLPPCFLPFAKQQNFGLNQL